MLVLTTDIASYKNSFPHGFIPENLDIRFSLYGEFGEPIISIRISLNLSTISFMVVCITCNTGDNYGHVDPQTK
jgi:hypothetical protein